MCPSNDYLDSGNSTDFDPAKVPHAPKSKQGLIQSRIMIPLTCQCSDCGTIMNAGKKFNGKKEDSGQRYCKTIPIWRLYFKCSGCCRQITFLTDPESRGYKLEHGAIRLLDHFVIGHENFQAAWAEKREKEGKSLAETLTESTYQSRDLAAGNDQLLDIQNQQRMMRQQLKGTLPLLSDSIIEQQRRILEEEKISIDDLAAQRYDELLLRKQQQNHSSGEDDDDDDSDRDDDDDEDNDDDNDNIDGIYTPEQLAFIDRMIQIKSNDGDDDDNKQQQPTKRSLPNDDDKQQQLHQEITQPQTTTQGQSTQIKKQRINAFARSTHATEISVPVVVQPASTPPVQNQSSIKVTSSLGLDDYDDDDDDDDDVAEEEIC